MLGLRHGSILGCDPGRQAPRGQALALTRLSFSSGLLFAGKSLQQEQKKLEGKNLKLDTFLPLAVAAVPCNHSPTPNNLGGKNPKCRVWIFVEGSLGPGPGIPVFKGTGSLGVSPCPGIPPWIWGSPRHSAFPPGRSFVPCFLGHVIILMIAPFEEGWD